MNRAAPHLLRDFSATFASGALAGVLLIGGIWMLDLEAARSLLDVGGNGLDLKDTGAVSWIFGQMALLGRYVVPGLLHL
ncbi:MAG: hypothetical protein B7Z15_07105 [Rhizobiales bacterium 32-66-8]|nr:MAG: hypothetical protein B7Z15_07105 [Rhizobiales bacterium 32-66-8]